MLNNNTSLGLHADSNVNTTLHHNTDLKADAQGKSFVDKVKEAASQVGEQVSSVGKQIGDAIATMNNKDARLEPVLNNVNVPTPNQAHDIAPHNQTEKPHWHAHAHTEEVSNSGVLNQGAFVDGVGNNILDKESEKHGVLASEKTHFDAHPHTHDVSNSGALNQAAFVGGASILAKESEKAAINGSGVVDASTTGKAHWTTHEVPTGATLADNVYTQGSVNAQSGFVAHADHSGAHAGMFDKVGSDLIAKEKADAAVSNMSAAASNLVEQGKEKIGQLGEKIGELGDKVKASLESNTSASTSTSASANVHTSTGLGL